MIRQNRVVADPALERTSTPWTSRDVTAPLRAFLRTESGSAGILVAAIVAALIWANIDVVDFKLSPEDLARIGEIDSPEGRVGAHPDQFRP